ncbi:unnamed protein product [Cercospora beticola]|nr:unnamed protein product [Cercospora beticola]
MAPQTRDTTLTTSGNLGDPVQSKALQRRLKSLAKQRRLEEQQLLKANAKAGNSTSTKMTMRRRPKLPTVITPTLSGKQKLLQHRANLLRGKERGFGGASVKKESAASAEGKTKQARRNKARRRNAVAKKKMTERD